MESSQDAPRMLIVKELVFLLCGFVFGYGLATGYFVYMAPKPAPEIVEKVMWRTATSTNSSSVPPRVYSFKTLVTLDSTGSTTTLSGENASTTENMLSALKGDRQFPAYYTLGTPLLNGAIVSGGNALLKLAIPKGDSDVNYVIDIENNKVTDVFGSSRWYFMDKGTFVYGDDGGLSYYSYGASSSEKLPNSSLSDSQSYVAIDGPDGKHFQVIATTTNSITLGVFSTQDGVETPGTATTTQYKKTGERMFIIP